MATLINQIIINAPKEKVWLTLTDLELLDQFDPGVRKSELVSSVKNGLGAGRKCEVKPKGWFKEKIIEWNPNQSLALELFECTLPVKSLKHRYTFTELDGKTHIEQVMEYHLKMGVIGMLLDKLMVRKKWDAGIKGFLAGLKAYIEKQSN